MKKRFLCALLTLIMLVSLVPATALTASAAGYTTSERAITVLKQWNGYKSTCNENGYTGYGTKCEVKATHGAHGINEKQADTALRAVLKDLDKAINSFSSNAGISLTQGQHDALVLFSFDNGTAWTTGTGSFRSAVVNGLRGSDFLNAICNWNNSVWDDERRMVEANMYLNGAYSSTVPSNFITVAFNPNGGDMGRINWVQYIDLGSSSAIDIVPTMTGFAFTGWYESTLDFNSYNDDEFHFNDDMDPSSRITTLSSKHNYRVLVAGWVEENPAYDPEDYEKGNVGSEVYYVIPTSDLVHHKVYKIPHTESIDTEKETALDYCFEEGFLRIDRDYLDSEGVRWCRIHESDTPDVTTRWVKVKLSGSTSNSSLPDIDVTVTVTNSYVRARTEDSIYSRQNGTYQQGQQLRIINTSSNDGFLWGQVAKSATDNTPICWIALMYTNWESVRNQTNVNKSTAIATAAVTGVAYVNVRNGAGTENQIVGALSEGTKVDIYEIKYVNGHRWGRCNTGWFSLSYADVIMLAEDNSYKTDSNYLSYVFTGTLSRWANIFKAPSETADLINTYQRVQRDVTITQLVSVYSETEGQYITWGKIDEGWVMVSYEDGTPAAVVLDTVKYTVTADSLTVRSTTSHSGDRINALVKGVEFNVNNGKQIVVTSDSVWAWAYKVVEDNSDYQGWVNLASSGVSRTNLPVLEDNNEDAAVISNKKATVVNTDNVNVREYNDATYAKIGSLPRGTTVAVWEEEGGWYKIDSNRNGVYDYEGDGWVSSKYLNVFDANDASSNATGSAGSASANVETGLGVVANTYTGVNVRAGAGTGYAPKGKILAGSTVEILEVKAVGNSKWGRVTQGWICMDYVTMVSNYPIAGAAPSGSASSGSTSNTTASETVIFTGKLINDAKVQTEPDMKSEIVRYVSTGSPVTVHELLTVEVVVSEESTDTTTTVKTEKQYWARTNDGYIWNPQDIIAMDPLAEKTYTVTSYVNTVDNELKVYKTAGSGEVTGSTLNMYDTVSVTTLEIVGNNLWCRVEYTDDNGVHQVGYVKMKYLTNGVVSRPSSNNSSSNNNSNNNTNNNAGNTNNVVIGSSGNTANQGNNGYVNNSAGYRYTGRVIRTGSVNVRANPSQGADLTTTLKQGAAMVIYETVVSEGMAWGRCDAGWVYLYYVDLQPCNNAVDAKVVYNENTIAYTDANCTGVAGTYSRMSVVDIYEQVGSMCRTDLGWVHIDNLG